MNNAWNSPQVRLAVKDLIPQIISAQPEPRISEDIVLNDNEKALSFYLAKAMVRISNDLV